MTLRVLVAGQRSFGAAAADLVRDRHDLVGVVAPYESGGRPDQLRAYGDRVDVPVLDRISPDTLPGPVDVILAAHSHAFIGRRTRSAARLAAIGYHPSLLPLHRGRDAVRWTIRDRDRVAGGSIYHLTDAVDAGPIAAQDYVLVPPGSTPSSLWRDLLFPLGLQLIDNALDDLDHGLGVAVPQDEACATWEPSWERPPLHRPELPELTAGASRLTWTADRRHLKGAR